MRFSASDRSSFSANREQVSEPSRDEATSSISDSFLALTTIELGPKASVLVSGDSMNSLAGIVKILIFPGFLISRSSMTVDPITSIFFANASVVSR